MSKGIVTRITGTLSLLVLFINPKDIHRRLLVPVRFMFYNVENLFDTYDDSLTDDNEFLPGRTETMELSEI